MAAAVAALAFGSASMCARVRARGGPPLARVLARAHRAAGAAAAAVSVAAAACTAFLWRDACARGWVALVGGWGVLTGGMGGVGGRHGWRWWVDGVCCWVGGVRLWVGARVGVGGAWLPPAAGHPGRIAKVGEGKLPQKEKTN
jgi:hypothetical protein